MTNINYQKFFSKRFMQDDKCLSLHSITKFCDAYNIPIQSLPYTVRIILENQLRQQKINDEIITSLQQWPKTHNGKGVSFYPSRILMQDFTGVPAMVDLAAIREQVDHPAAINPIIPVDLVIDHSLQVDFAKTNAAFLHNTLIETTRNKERYTFLKWAQKSFNNLRVVPPGRGICHQVNLEFLAQVVCEKDTNSETICFPDSLVGTDSHTTMINGIGVLGWGVGGIEAEAAMLGQPVSIMLPKVVGVELQGKVQDGVTATDVVLHITQLLRSHGVVSKFIEFIGPGVAGLSIPDRATIANMAPEFGATCAFFPVDDQVISYMKLTNRNSRQRNITAAYCKAQKLWLDNQTMPKYSEYITLDLRVIQPCIAGPSRPQDKLPISKVKQKSIYTNIVKSNKGNLNHGSIVIAAITSCTNTSNPEALISAAILAKKALSFGLKIQPWIKTSFAPGSRVVTEYLDKMDLSKYLDAFGFNLVGYGCTTCIGNSGPLDDKVVEEILADDLDVCAILSGNRNFSGRINPYTKSSWLASPPLVIAYAIAGTMNIDLTKQAIGTDSNGAEIYLADIWPTDSEINEYSSVIGKEMFANQYADIFLGEKSWQELPEINSDKYPWDKQSTYIKQPDFFNLASAKDIVNAKILSMFGNHVTTDHISPAGNIAKNTDAGKYLMEKNIKPDAFNSYGSRRGNHELMIRGTFANPRINNLMLGKQEGGFTKISPDSETISIYKAAMYYQKNNTPLVIIAGENYGSGSSRDWAAKGTKLLGIQAIIAKSFERIHRSNLIGMGVLPLQFKDNESISTLDLTGYEELSINGIANMQEPAKMLTASIKYTNGLHKNIELICRIDTEEELAYYMASGILPYTLQKIANPKS